ncbi:MAG: histidine kinase N-terminal 7TM domain-containing protein, partial [Methanobacteriota archaeon]
MALDLVPAWPAAGSLAGGAGALALAWAVREHRGRPGVDWFLGVFAAQATWCCSYGLGLLVADPTLRTALEATTWFGVIWTGIAFLGFALEYTGRSDVVRSRLFGTIVGFGLLSSALVATNSLHGAFWTDFGRDPAFGVETVSYAFGPWAYLTVAAETVLVASAVFLLVDTLLSYGPLYRRESAAVALSPIPPGFALVAWALALGPVPQLQLAPIMFVPHVLLDAYAFDRAEMFDRNPTTSRAAERTAIDDLRDPVVALALDRRVVRLNPAAETVLGVDAETARGRPLADFLDLPVAVDDEADGADGGDAVADSGSGEDASGGSRETVEIDAADGTGRRRYAVSVSRLTDPNGTHVGYTVILSDATERERRRQQLEVLNRILRHNLRNDACVVRGYGEILRDRLEDPELERMADAVERRAGALAALGEKAGTVERLLAESDPAATDVRALLDSVDAVESGRETALEHGSGLGLWVVAWGAAAVGA